MLTITKQDAQEIKDIIGELVWVNDVIASLKEFYCGDDLDKAIDKLGLARKFNRETDILQDKFKEIVRRSDISVYEEEVKMHDYRFDIASYESYDFYCDIYMHDDLCEVLDITYGVNNVFDMGGWYTIGYKK
jgi:hypothetical protein